MFVLKAVGGEATPTEISRWLFRGPQTISQLLVRMERLGLVKRVRRSKRSTTDNTLLQVSLTEKGEALFRQQNETKEVVGNILSLLPAEQRSSLRACLEILREGALEELAVKPELPYP